MYETIEVRIRLESQKDLEWADLHAFTFPAKTAEEADRTAAAWAKVRGCWEVRWNWGGNVAGLGQGHYIPGEAQHRHYGRV